MPKINGNLVFVSSRAAQVSEVWVRAPRVRTHAEGVVTTGNDRFPVTGGEVEFTAVPGPAVLALISQGRAVDTIPIVVGEGESQSLQNVVRAAQVADDSTQREIERLSAEMMDALGAARAEAESASGFAARAGESADEAAASASEAAEFASGAASSESSAARYAEQAGGHASAASSSASMASNSEHYAEEFSTAAAAFASQAAGSASSVKADADRVANIADSTSWSGDKLTVNGKTSPPLTGPKGDRGDSGASAWEDITGKPSTFPPESHKHTSADITDTTNDAGSSEFGGRVLVPRAKDGKIFYYSDPTEYRELARKGYVDSVGNTKADKSHKHTSADIDDSVSYFGYSSYANRLVRTNSSGKIQIGSAPTGGSDVVPKSYVDALEARVDQRPALFSGSGAPPRYLTGARAGDWWLNETTMELHKITSV